MTFLSVGFNYFMTFNSCLSIEEGMFLESVCAIQFYLSKIDRQRPPIRRQKFLI